VRTSSPLRAAAVLALAIVALPTPSRAQQAPGWARDQLAAWYAAFNAGDAKAVAALYAADAVIVPPGVQPIRGRAAIEAHHVSAQRDIRFSCSGGYDGFQIVAGTAVGWGHDDCTETPRAGGAAKATKSRWIAVYEKQADGSWLIVRDVGEETRS
jgi:uncharacterized protein (TIGR02246 family)